MNTAPTATPPLLFKLANMLWARSDITPRAQGRDEAIAFGRRAVIGDPDSVPYGRTLIAMLQARCGVAGRVDDLDKSVDLVRQVVAIAADEEGPLASLTGALWARWRSVGERADLDETIATGEKLVAVVPAGDEDLTLYQGSLGHAYRDRYEHYHNPADRAAAEKWERLAGVKRHPWDDAVGPGDGDGWASKRGLQGGALLERANAEEDPAALDRGIILIEQAIELFSAGHPAKVEAMANLTAARWLRFVRIGDLTDLDKAIDTGRAAVSAGGVRTSRRA